MKITKTSDIEYSIEFNELETQIFEDIEDMFEVKPEQVIEKSISESLRQGSENAGRFVKDVLGD